MSWSSFDDFVSDMRDSYEASGLSEAFQMNEPPGGPIGELLWELKDEHDTTGVSSTEIGLKIFDWVLSDAILWHYLFSLELSNRMGERPDDFLRAISVVSLRVTSDAIVIRDLVSRGFDTQAKSILRSVDEATDFFYYLCLSEDACSEYVKAQDEDSSNAFWHKHISKGKARRKIKREIKNFLSDAELDDYVQYRRGEKKFLDSAHHPSFQSGFMTLLTPGQSSNVFDGLFGVRSELSFRTARYLIYLLVEMIILTPWLAPRVESIIQGSDELVAKYLKPGRQHVLRSFILLFQNQGSELFGRSREMDRFLDEMETQ